MRTMTANPMIPPSIPPTTAEFEGDLREMFEEVEDGVIAVLGSQSALCKPVFEQTHLNQP